MELVINKSSVEEEIAAIGDIINAINKLDNSTAERVLLYGSQWLEDRMKPQPPVTRGIMIVGVAIRSTRGVVFSLPQPNRHHDVIRAIVERTKKHVPYTWKQGFVDEDDKFYTRNQASRHAKKCGQISDNRFHRTELFSEDLW